jgi:hypothetical protein
MRKETEDGSRYYAHETGVEFYNPEGIGYSELSVEEVKEMYEAVMTLQEKRENDAR